MQRFFLYARKSSDVEDKQVLSIEAQLTELRAFVKRESLHITHEFIEKQSAKIPGRPLFNDMLSRLEAGEADGIVSWHPDRLARNSVDGGRVVFLLDTNRLASLKFPQFWFENTPQGKFMLSIAFGQSKYYVDSLSENTKRGLRQKVRRGEYPALAPVGYINDVRTKQIVVDRKRSVVIAKAFELYAKGDSRIEDIVIFLAQSGVLTRGNKPLHQDRISYILTNPFYYGHFKYAGELYEGSHQPIISKKLFDLVQEVMNRRSHPRKSNDPKVLCGLLRCADCGMMITAEVQKGHIYYRCTRKSKVVQCSQPYVREEVLEQQLSSLLHQHSLREDWAMKILEKMKSEESEIAQSSGVLVKEAQKKIRIINDKLQRLLDSYLEQDIDRETYLNKKAELMSTKRSLE